MRKSDTVKAKAAEAKAAGLSYGEYVQHMEGQTTRVTVPPGLETAKERAAREKKAAPEPAGFRPEDWPWDDILFEALEEAAEAVGRCIERMRELREAIENERQEDLP